MALRPAILLLGCALILLAASCASAAIVEHTFHVKNLTIAPLCKQQTITAVNGSLPGPTIRVREGDTLIVHVVNLSPHNMTIHWHGVFQLMSGWADGPEYVTQCPIVPKNSFTYKFNITGQEGTLWWHAHISYLRATVHGALVILPKKGRTYPFPKPHKEVPIILGEWWDADVVDIIDDSTEVGGPPELSDALTINGQPGDLYNCSSNSTYKLKVQQGKTYLLRIVNAGMQSLLFFKIANHSLTVVAVDASYVNQYVTDTITIAPGQTVDALFKADQPRASYYMAAHAYQASDFVAYDNTTTTGIIEYERATKPLTPIMPIMPDFHDTPVAHKFLSNLTGLVTAPFWHPVPLQVDAHMFITIGVGVVPCGRPGNLTCEGFTPALRLAASMNNESFVAPTKMSMLEAFFNNVSGIYTEDFPDEPVKKFDYTNPNISLNLELLMTQKSTKVRKFRFNDTVEIVFQNTALGTIENHPMHLHGFDMYILAQGFGNYNPVSDPAKYNLVNPQLRNTIAVPIGGWAAVRFRANNPGVWFIHCHLEVHMPWGLTGAFVVENGPTPETSLPPPPLDLPKC